jgi:hypothetical protein
MICSAPGRIIIRCTMKRASLHLIVNSICCAKIRTTDKSVEDCCKVSLEDKELPTKSTVQTKHKDGDSTDSFSD